MNDKDFQVLIKGFMFALTAFFAFCFLFAMIIYFSGVPVWLIYLSPLLSISAVMFIGYAIVRFDWLWNLIIKE